MERKILEPPVSVRDADGERKYSVEVGPPNWTGYTEVMEELTRLDLPLPVVTRGFQAWLAQVQIDVDTARTSEDLAFRLAKQQTAMLGLLADLLTNNLDVLKAWAIKHHSLVRALALACSNLTPDGLEQLDPGQVLRVARAGFEALRATGAFEEYFGFFGAFMPSSQTPRGSEGVSSNKKSNRRPGKAPAVTAA